MPGAQIEFPDGAGNVEPDVPSGYFDVGVQITDHDNPLRHRHLQSENGNSSDQCTQKVLVLANNARAAPGRRFS